MTQEKLKDITVVTLLLFPIISRWIFPTGVEMLLYSNLLSIPIYTPNLLIIGFAFLARKKENDNIHLKLLFALSILISILSLMLNSYNAKFAFFISGTFYYYAILLALNSEITLNQQLIIRRILFIVLLILSTEVLLYSTGVLAYSADIHSDLDMAGVFRISTTMGAATGSGVIIFLLGTLLYNLYQSVKMRYVIMIITAVTLLMLMSRGPILAYVLFAVLVFRKNIKFKHVLMIGLTCYVLYTLGVFNPIMTRMEVIDYNGDASTGRLDLIENLLSNFKMQGANLFGLGVGNVYNSSDLQRFGIRALYYAAPHNTYILTYAEQGLIGLTIFLVFWLSLLYAVRRNKNIQYILFSTAVVLFNTETILLVDSEYALFIAIIVMIGMSKKKSNSCNYYE